MTKLSNASRRILASLLAGGVSVLCTGLAVAQDSEVGHVQAESLIDRRIDSPGHDQFKAATALPAVSPAARDATANDLRVQYTGLMGPERIDVVVRKPVADGRVYQIPDLSDGLNAYEFLKDHLDNGINRGVGLIRFPAGQVFEIDPPNPSGRHLKFEGLTDVVVDLNGSTLQFMQTSLGVLFEDCQRVVLMNGTIRGKGLLATVARVLPDNTPAGVKFEVLPQYRQQIEQHEAAQTQLHTVGSAEQSPDGQWRMGASGYAEMFVNRGDKKNNFRYSTDDGAFVGSAPVDGEVPFQLGSDHVWLLHHNNSGHGLLLDNEDGKGNEDITIQNVAFVNIPGMVIVGEVVRGLHLKNIDIRTDGAGSPSFLAAASDGVHINGSGGDIVIEDSYFGPNGDDKINIKGNYWRVTAMDWHHSELTVAPAGRKTSVNRWGWAGHKLVFIDPDFEVIGTAVLQRDSEEAEEKSHRIFVDAIPKGVDIGDIVGNISNAAARVVIRNNVFKETRAQGVLVQTSHVIVENNLFERIAGPPIKLNLALDGWYEAINTSNVAIIDNRFVESATSVEKPKELIYFHELDGQGNAVKIIDNVVIAGNEISTQPSEER